MITFTELIVTREGKVVLPFLLEKAFPPHRSIYPLRISRSNKGLHSNCCRSNAACNLYTFPSRTWSDTDITQLLRFRNKSILAGDLNTKYPFFNSTISKPSAEKLLQIFDANDFEISAPQYPPHYSSVENDDVLDILVHQNIRISHVTVSDILDSDHLPIVFHTLISS
jgi:hypothetical protein